MMGEGGPEGQGRESGADEIKRRSAEIRERASRNVADSLPEISSAREDQTSPKLKDPEISADLNEQAEALRLQAIAEARAALEPGRLRELRDRRETTAREAERLRVTAKQPKDEERLREQAREDAAGSRQRADPFKAIFDPESPEDV